MYNPKVRYILNSVEFGRLVLTNDPENWKDDIRTLDRSRKSFSFITKYSESLVFVKEGAEYLYNYRRAFAPQGEVTLTREEVNPDTDVYEEIYKESLDIKKSKYKDQRFQTRFLSGGFDELIKEQLNEKYELDRLKDLEGNTIDPLTYSRLGLTGRKLFLESFLRNKEDVSVTGTTNFFSFNHNLVYESDDQVNSVLNPVDNFIGFGTGGSIFFDPNQVMYINRSGRTRQLKITLSAKGRQNQDFTGAVQRFEFALVTNLLENGISFQWDGNVNNRQIFEVFQDGTSGNILDFDFTTSLDVSVLNNTAIGIFCFATSATQYTFNADAENLSVLVEEDSSFQTTQNNALTMHNALERNTEIVTGSKDNFRSDYFKSGEFKDLLIASGKMIRNLPKLDEDRKPTSELESITTSLKQLLSVSGYLNTGYGVIKEGVKKKLVVEDLKFFFQTFIAFRLGNVSDIERDYANDYAYKSIKIGNKDAGDYEEQQGRFEYNSENKYQFNTTLAENEYDATSDLRSDLIGVEYARRKEYAFAPSEDTEYDKFNFLFDAKLSGNSNVYDLRRWQDEYISEPKKVYDPTSAGNLRLSPFISLERHAWVFKTALEKFPNESVRYASTTGYSEIITQKAGEVERAENGNILNSDLEKARFDDEIVTFNIKMTFALRKQLYGQTKVNDRLVPNTHGLVEFINEFGDREYGWILSAKESELGEFKLIKAQFNNA